MGVLAHRVRVARVLLDDLLRGGRVDAHGLIHRGDHDVPQPLVHGERRDGVARRPQLGDADAVGRPEPHRLVGRARHPLAVEGVPRDVRDVGGDDSEKRVISYEQARPKQLV